MLALSSAWLSQGPPRGDRPPLKRPRVRHELIRHSSLYEPCGSEISIVWNQRVGNGEPHFRELEPAGGLAAAGRGTADGGMMPCILTGAPDVLTLRLSET